MQNLVIVNTFGNGFQEQCASWCGWLLYQGVNYYTTTDPETKVTEVRCDTVNAERVRQLQCINPARYGNPPEVKLAMETGDGDFLKRFYAAPLDKRYLVAGKN